MLKSLCLSILEYSLKLNFALAVSIMLGVVLLSLGTDYQVFDDNAQLYGAIAYNLRFILFYSVLIEVNLLLYCWHKQSVAPLLWLGFFYILMIGGLEFYGEINQIIIDPNYFHFFTYQGISHILFSSYQTFYSLNPDS